MSPEAVALSALLFIALIGLIAAIIIHDEAQKRWEKERGELLDRIQGPEIVGAMRAVKAPPPPPRRRPRPVEVGLE